MFIHPMLPPIIEHEGRYFHQMTGASRYYLSRSGAVYSTHIKQVMKIPTQSEGYLQTWFTLDSGGRKRLQVHRLVALQFIPNPEHKPFVNHLDFNKKNCRVSNLEWVTTRENESHSRAFHPCYQKNRGLSAAPLFCKLVPCCYVVPTPFRFTPQPATIY